MKKINTMNVMFARNNPNFLKVINVIDFCQNRFGLSSTHSELAMTAAKKMSRTKLKEKTGHKVCRHLLDMLAEDQPDSDFCTSVDKGANSSHVKEDKFWFGTNLIAHLSKADNSGQISLSF